MEKEEAKKQYQLVRQKTIKDENLDNFPLLPGSGHFAIGDSKIHGKGVIALRDIPANTNLGPGLIKGDAAFTEFFRELKSEEEPDQAKRVAEASRQLKEAAALAAKEATDALAKGASEEEAAAAQARADAAATAADIVLWQLGYTNWVNHAKAHTCHAVARKVRVPVEGTGAQGWTWHEGAIFGTVTSRDIKAGEELAIYYPDAYTQYGIAQRIQPWMLAEDKHDSQEPETIEDRLK